MKTARAFFARYRWLLPALATCALIVLGFGALGQVTRQVHYAQVKAAVQAVSPWQVWTAVALTAASYLALTLYDVLALRVIDRRLGWRTAALASFASYTLSHNLGLSLITGGSARYRVYTAAGLDGADIARVIGLAAGTFWLGVVTIAGGSLMIHSGPVLIAGLSLSQAAINVAGVVVVMTIAALVMLAGFVRAPIRLFGFRSPVPQPAQLVAQIGIALVDITCASAALYVLIPGADIGTLPTFILAYSLGMIVTVVSHVPGGMGVFEAVVLAIVPGDRTTIFAALITYRLIYYLLPLVIGVVLLVIHEGRQQRARDSRVGRLLSGAQRIASGLSPLVLSGATFVGGGMLLLSGSLPSLHDRMGVLAHVLPLPFIEASHIAASLVGTGLLLLAPGLYRRLDGAFHTARLLLLAGALFSMMKGIDYEEAIVCLTLAGLLQWTRGAFYRRTSLTQQPLSGAWLASVAMMVALATWAGLFAYRRVPYSDSLWWNFALHGDAPRFLRGMLGIAVLLGGALLWRLFAPAPGHDEARDAQVDLGTIRAILQQATRTDSMLALTGDKRFIVSESGDAFLMYQVKAASWIMMGDPVGAPDAWAELLWELRDRADRQQGRLLLYEVSAAVLDIVIGLGLQIIKFGEEAVVELDTFVLDTPRLRSLRKSQRLVAREGAEFRIVPAPAVPVILDALEAVSSQWMRSKGQREKSFSLGRFDRDYIANFDIAVVTVDDRIVAFANLWLTDIKTEVSVDLMRHSDDAPRGTMDFLFVNLMSWAKARGYQRFSLGMAPLSGIDGRRLAPTWAKIAALVFRHGERIYGFRGLHGYKEKFAPVWEPRYVAGPRGVALIQGLRDLSRLIGQGPPRAGRRRPAGAPPRLRTASASDAPRVLQRSGA